MLETPDHELGAKYTMEKERKQRQVFLSASKN